MNVCIRVIHLHEQKKVLFKDSDNVTVGFIEISTPSLQRNTVSPPRVLYLPYVYLSQEDDAQPKRLTPSDDINRAKQSILNALEAARV